MPALRCTARLLKALKATPVEPTEVPASRLGDWTANLIRVSRIQLVVAANGATRLPVVVDAAPYATLLRRLPNAIGLMLVELGIALEDAADEIAHMTPLVPAASDSRSVLANLNHYAEDIDAALRYGICNSSLSLTRHMAEGIVLKPMHIGSPANRVREAFGLPRLEPEDWAELRDWWSQGGALAGDYVSRRGTGASH
ncbi:DUF6933 domain-containing protein [Coralloluteibacterium stylophorae]|uniref:DUF6933 domain-containing protein n=1 Tax=Coralloluteibacterium stylophorae TaxID=1776034 RepID=A0A8J7VX40_9GAMM|nr:hypothetical protein [Coralloluteibacterium stylophorae]MBS7455724.1 hypothetical protein [Coralloluteibacterium stylophorae]